MTWNASCKSQIRVTDSQNVLDILMEVVELKDGVGVELALHTEVNSIGVRRGKGGVNADGDAVGGKGTATDGEIAERIVGKQTRRRADGSTGGIGELLWSETGEGLDVLDVDDGVCRDWRVARRNDRVQVIDTIERFAAAIWKFCRAVEAAGGNLRIGEVGGGAWYRKSYGGKKNGESAGISVVQTREGKKCLGNEVGPAKSRDVSSQPDAKMIIKESPACPENRFWRKEPREAQPG